MKNNFVLIMLLIGCSNLICAQDWGGFPISQVIDNSVLIFEGRILTDSVYLQNPPGEVATYHKVLVLKQFKGSFNSDTIVVVNFGGKMIIDDHWEGDRNAYAKIDDEAVFMLNTYWTKFPNPDFYFIGYGDGCGFVKICDKKDVAKEVYEPIEAVTGQSYVEVHPNNCATQQK